MAKISKQERKAATVSHYGVELDCYVDFDGQFCSVALAGSDEDITELVKEIGDLEVELWKAVLQQQAEARRERFWDRQDELMLH